MYKSVHLSKLATLIVAALERGHGLVARSRRSDPHDRLL
jgi:hypothetical protein